MKSQITKEENEEQIRNLLGRWAYTTRLGLRDEVLSNHAPDVVIYDVLPPMKYEQMHIERVGTSGNRKRQNRAFSSCTSLRTLPTVRPLLPTALFNVAVLSLMGKSLRIGCGQHFAFVSRKINGWLRISTFQSLLHDKKLRKIFEELSIGGGIIIPLEKQV